MVLGLLNKLQIFWQLYLIEARAVNKSEPHLIYPRLTTGFCMLVFFTSLSLTEFRVRYLALFHLSTIIDLLEWFWTEIYHKSIPSMLEFLKAPFLVLHFSSYTYTLMTFLMMLLLSSYLCCDDTALNCKCDHSYYLWN